MKLRIQKGVNFWCKHIILYSIALLMFLPIIFLFFTSLKTDIEVYDGVWKLPSNLHWINYVEVWTDARFNIYFKNSIIVSVVTTIFVLIISSLAGFAFAKFQFFSKNVLFFVLLLGLMIPSSAIIIPLYYILRDAGLLNTAWGLILPQVGLGLPFGIFLMRQFFKDIPDELMDSAFIDGCGKFGAFWYIYLPIARKGLESLAVIQFVFVWNEYFLPLIVSQDDSAQTLTVGLYRVFKSYVSSYAKISAGAILVFLPILLLYFILHRQFISGITSGSLKG